MLLAAAWLAVVGALLYLPHFQHGGFYLDDWNELAARFHPPGGSGFSHVMSFFVSGFEYRPGLILYNPARLYALGAHTSLELIWTVGLAVLIAAMVYALLRKFNLPWYHAWVVAALTLLFPWSDSPRLWVAATCQPLAIAFALGGILLALRGLERRSWNLHILALALYAASVLTYEITLPLIVAAGLLYVLHAGWTRDVRLRWAADLAVVIAAGLWDGTHTPRTISSLSGDITHLKQIVIAGGTILGRSLYPLGPHGHTTTALMLIAAVFAAGIVAFLWRRRADGEAGRPPHEGGWGLKHWLVLGGAGIVVAALGWVMLVPADPYYTPSIYGITNRTNALAGLGLVLVLYAAGGVAASLVGRALSLNGRIVAAVIVGLGICLGAAYGHVLERHIGIWDDAYRAERQGIDSIRQAYPTLPPESVVIGTNYPAYETLGVPIFSSTWDLRGMIQLEYGDSSLNAFPRAEGIELDCARAGFQVTAVGQSPIAFPYRHVRFVDVQSRRHRSIANPRQCRQALREYPAGPTYLTTAY